MNNPKIVSIAEIPKPEDIVMCPTNDLRALYKICLKMQMLCLSESGVGLSAVQVGIPWRLFIAVNNPQDPFKFRYFVNCNYTPLDEEKIMSVEGCLSLKNTSGEFRRFKVNRFKNIRLVGQELLARDRLELVDVNEIYEGDLSVIYQHECDHASNITISDIGDEIFVWR